MFSRIWLFVTPWTIACQVPRPWDFSSKGNGVGSHALLRGISPTQGSIPCLLSLLHCQAYSLPLSHLRVPSKCSVNTCWENKQKNLSLQPRGKSESCKTLLKYEWLFCNLSEAYFSGVLIIVGVHCFMLYYRLCPLCRWVPSTGSWEYGVSSFVTGPLPVWATLLSLLPKSPVTLIFFSSREQSPPHLTVAHIIPSA